MEEKHRDYHSTRSATELCPYLVMVRPDMILTKDGGLLVCYAFDGVDIESTHTSMSDQYAELIEHGHRMFDERITVWWTVDRRITVDYPGGEFPDAISSFINDSYRSTFLQRGQYRNRHYFSVLYRQPRGAMGFMDMVGYYATVEGQGFFKSITSSIRASFEERTSFALDQLKLDNEMRKFDEMLNSFDGTIRDVRLRRLEEGELLTFLHDRASPASVGQPVREPNADLYLDGYLPDNEVYVGNNLLLFENQRQVYTSGISVKDWPNWTETGLLDIMLALPAELTLSQCFEFVEDSSARRQMDAARRHFVNSQKSIATYVMEAATKKPSDKIDQAKVALAQDVEDAKTEMSLNGYRYGNYNMTLLVFADTANEAHDAIKMASDILTQTGFITIRESQHLLSAWAGTMPGQWAEIVRWFFLNTANLADMAPIRTLASGGLTCKYLSSQTGRHCPSVTALPTQYNTPFYFDFYNSGDLAHTLVIGPTRSGKSVFNNFLISQFRKYHPCRVRIFDKNYSCRIPTLLQDGVHIDMSGASDMVRLNPLHLLGERRHWDWIARWLERLITVNGYPYTTEDQQSVWHTIEELASYDPSQWTLTSVVALLGGRKQELAHELSPWIQGGQFGKYFDNVEDHFNLSDFVCMEIGGLLNNARLANAFMDYAFYMLKLQLDGTPTLIYIEEAWFMLADPRFREEIEDMLRTFAKFNAFLVMATQSLEEIAKSDIFSVLIDSIPNRIFLANREAMSHYDMYRTKFGLNDEQIETIRSAVPKQNYYFVTPAMNRLVSTVFTPEVLACLRSDARSQKVFLKHYQQRGEHWKADYIDEVCNVKLAA